MARRDYYAILGIPRGAGPDEVKKAFRALAMRWHPDRNPGDAEAERHFREIAEAWDVLGDPEKRARYDRMGPLFTHDGKPPRPEELNEILLDALGGLFGRKKPGDRGDDIRYTLTLSLEEAARGAERTISIQRTISCRDCGATGDAQEGRAPCTDCGGTGRATTRRFLRNDCPFCAGKGYKPAARCPRCNGETRTVADETLKVKIPPGVSTGQKLKLRGKGNDGPGVPGGVPGPAGDLLVLIDVEDHPLFRRRGADLLCEVPVTFVEAALGCDLSVPTLDAVTTIRVPPGTPSGKSFRLPGRGLQSPDGKARGDLHVKLAVEVPPALDEAAKQALLEFSRCAGGECHPQKRAFAEAMGARPAGGKSA